VEDSGAGNLAQHASGIRGQALGERATYFTIERPLGVEKVRTVEHSPHHVPFGEADRVIPHGVENSAVDLSFCFRMGCAGGSMPE
jgi:hypothetical protein